MPEFNVTTNTEWDAAVKRLRSADKTVRVEMGKEIRKITAPIVKEMRQEILGMDSRVTGISGGARSRARTAAERAKDVRAAKERAQRRLERGGYGLRKTIAQSIRTKISLNGRSQGVRIRVDPARLGVAGRKLPRNIDKGRWRHPVFGNRENWVEQTNKPGWFTATAAKHQATARNDIMHAIQRAVKKIEG